MAAGERRAWADLAGDPASMWRDAAPRHFTASALPVADDGAYVCLVLHAKLGLWLQPGGHLETGDTSMTGAAAREVEEETGLAVVVDPIPVLLSRHRAPCGVGTWHMDVQMVAHSAKEEPTTSSESRDVAWFPATSLPDALAPGVDELVAAAVLRRSDAPGPRWPPG